MENGWKKNNDDENKRERAEDKKSLEALDTKISVPKDLCKYLPAARWTDGSGNDELKEYARQRKFSPKVVASNSLKGKKELKWVQPGRDLGVKN